jgi:hypothetical protein
LLARRLGCFEAELDGSHAYQVAGMEKHRLVNPLTVDERPVGASQVLDDVSIS